jgi:formate/nitrite transporter FocA (FNT family)
LGYTLTLPTEDKFLVTRSELVDELAMLLGGPIGAGDLARNLVPVIAGNIVGGSVLVAGVYYVIYVRGAHVRAVEAAPGTRGVPPS